MEVEDIRHQQWLSINHNNLNMWCLLVAVCGLDVIDYEEEVKITEN